MSQPSFYIFGVPNGFDILDGDINATSYFQSYYNPSKENTKFSIHRNTGDGGITYAYLKYNLSSGKGREGSFFGMALYFPEKAFCIDILKLYRLFDAIYDKVILADGEILKPTDGTSYIQAKYTITRFSEKREYISQRVLSNLLANLEKFADAFVDCSFTSENPDIGKRIPLAQADNDKLLSLLQRYNRLSISPDWGDIIGGPDPEPIPEEVLWSWNQKIKERSLYVNKCYRDLSHVNLSEVKKFYSQINQICETLKAHPYSPKADSAVLDCYNETYKEYMTLKKDYSSLITSIEKERSGTGGSIPPVPPPPLPTPLPWWKELKTWAIAGGVGVLLIVLVVILSNIFNTPTQLNRQPVIAQNTRSLISKGKYEEAIAMADSLDISLRKHLQDSAKHVCNKNVLVEIEKLQQENKYSDAYKLCETMYDGNSKDDKKKEIIAGCENFLENRCNHVGTDKTVAQKLLDDINACTVPIDKSKRQKMERKLSSVISSQPVPQPSKKVKYWIEMWKVTRENQIDFDWSREDKKTTINNSREVSGDFFYYRLMTQSSSSQGQPTSCPYKTADNHIHADNPELRTKGTYEGSYKIVKQKGVLTIKDDEGNTLFKITIN